METPEITWLGWVARTPVGCRNRTDQMDSLASSVRLVERYLSRAADAASTRMAKRGADDGRSIMEDSAAIEHRLAALFSW